MVRLPGVGTSNWVLLVRYFLRYGYSGNSKSPLETSSPGAGMNPSLSASFHLRFLFCSNDYAAPHKIRLRADVLNGRS